MRDSKSSFRNSRDKTSVPVTSTPPIFYRLGPDIGFGRLGLAVQGNRGVSWVVATRHSVPSETSDNEGSRQHRSLAETRPRVELRMIDTVESFQHPERPGDKGIVILLLL